MIRAITVAAVIVSVLAAPDLSFGEGEVEDTLVSGEEAKPSFGVSSEISEKINGAEKKLIENLMRTQIARQLLVEPNLETFLPVPENWKKYTDSTGAISYLVPLVETNETIAYKLLIDSLEKISPLSLEPELLTLSNE